MNIILVSSCLFILFLSSVSCDEYYELVRTQWESFKHQYSKNYTTEIEEKFRFKIYLENYREIIEHNELYAKNKTTFTVTINEFSDMHLHEINEMKKVFINSNTDYDNITNDSLEKNGNLLSKIYEPIPESINWVTLGAVTGVKNQQTCGSCWAFSATGTLEGQLYRTTGKLISLSEQNLIDCSHANNGCKYGIIVQAFEYLKHTTNGIDTEQSYPYKNMQDFCHYNPATRAAVITDYRVLIQNDESLLMEAVAKIGPISVTIDASTTSFKRYGGGVFYDPGCSSNIKHINHSVLVVGYGKDERTGMDYWLVKNSWGTRWGDGGYIKMARNMNNNCCISCLPIFPIIARF